MARGRLRHARRLDLRAMSEHDHSRQGSGWGHKMSIDDTFERIRAKVEASKKKRKEVAEWPPAEYVAKRWTSGCHPSPRPYARQCRRVEYNVVLWNSLTTGSRRTFLNGRISSAHSRLD